jgi:threonine synthase
MDYHYQCADCGSRYPQQEFLLRCPDCSGVLLIKHNLAARAARLRALFDFSTTDMWKYKPLLPVVVPDGECTLREGGTPLLAARRLAGEFGLARIRVKNETVNPTGSFKDRQVSVGIFKALEEGFDTVAVVSSGNVAASAAAGAARQGLKCLVFVPRTTPAEKLLQALSYGSRVCRVSTDSSSEIMELVEEACQKQGWYHLSTAGSGNPFNVEGARTIAYELYEQTEGHLPAILFVPVGGGGLLGGIHSGLSDLLELGLIDVLPELIGVQAQGCAPLVKAVEEGLGPREIMSQAWEKPQTIAGGIADDILFDAHRALAAVHESRGRAIAVSDDEITEAMRLLASLEGVFAEPSGAASLAGLVRLARSGELDVSKETCCLVTGSGLKDMDSAREITAPIREIEPNLTNVVNAND